MPDKPATYGRTKPRTRRSGSADLRDRSAAYVRQRARLLEAEPLCRYCRGRGHVSAAAILDHILALSLGGSNDPENLAPACAPCNAEKAKLEQRLATRGYAAHDARLDPELWEWLRLAAIKPPQGNTGRENGEE